MFQFESQDFAFLSPIKNVMKLENNMAKKKTESQASNETMIKVKRGIPLSKIISITLQQSQIEQILFDQESDR